MHSSHPIPAAPVRGNITTVIRIARSLGLAGAATIILAADSLSVGEMERSLADFRPDLIHGFHARHCGTITRYLAERRNLPFVITVTGSDIHDPLLREHPETLTVLRSAQGVVCFDEGGCSPAGGVRPASRRPACRGASGGLSRFRLWLARALVWRMMPSCCCFLPHSDRSNGSTFPCRRLRR
ncbi:MAG: hypothetical protein IPQ16_07110 [Geobacteraceae bacterium]|nr:hypothetical protein [Geobacteraceae bacterium]